MPQHERETAEDSQQLWSRRTAIQKLSAGALLSLGIWPRSITSADTPLNPSFRFLVVNDTHYMSEECGVWLEKAVQQMKRHSDAEFCLLVGDLVEDGYRDHLGAVADIFAALKIPVYPQIGNHDYLPENDRQNYEAVFPNRLNYWFEHRGCQFVGFDSTQGTQYDGTSIQPGALDWLKTTLPTLERERPTVIFTHFPLGAGVKYRPRNAEDALDLFREHNLRAVFNGHFHGLTEREWNHASVATNRCCALKRANHDGSKEKGYFLCTMRDGTVSREFVAVPG